MGLRGRKNIYVGSTYFITTTVVGFMRVFTEHKYCDILIKNIKHYQERYKFNVMGYVIMPSHLHWIVRINQAFGSISDIMRDIKKYSAWDIMEALENENKEEHIKLFQNAAVGWRNQKRKFWMERFDDEVIRTSEMLRTKLTYIHNNPINAGLAERPEEYKYSSARNYILGDHSILNVETEW